MNREKRIEASSPDRYVSRSVFQAIASLTTFSLIDEELEEELVLLCSEDAEEDSADAEEADDVRIAPLSLWGSVDALDEESGCMSRFEPEAVGISAPLPVSCTEDNEDCVS